MLSGEINSQEHLPNMDPPKHDGGSRIKGYIVENVHVVLIDGLPVENQAETK